MRLFSHTFTAFIFCLCLLKSQAQMMDSIRTSFSKKAALTGGFSTRQTFIDNFSAPVLNFRIGVDFNDRVRIGGGISFLKNPYLYKRTIPNIVTGTDITLQSELNLQYMNYYFEYVYYKTKHWEFSTPLDIGLGRTFETYDYNNEHIKDNQHLVFIYEPVVTGYYKVFYWFGIGADVGYRFLLTGDKGVRKQFNSPVYAFKTIIFWGALYHKVFPNSKLFKS